RSPFAVVLVLLFPVIACAQSAASRFASVAATGVAQSNAWSVTQNPAGLAFLRSAQLAVNYENPFAIENLGVKSASAALPVNRGTFGAFAQSQSFDSYHRFQSGLAYGRSFGDDLAFGLTVNYFQTSITGYGNASNISASIGVQYHLNEEFAIGLLAENLLQNKQAGHGDLQPKRVAAALRYTATAQVELHAEIERNNYTPLTGRFALSYRPAEKFTLRGGLDLKPFSQFAAFGVEWKKIAFNIACTSHQALGITPSIGLGYAF
ncbi:MAG: hypothetical protein INR69_21005, partial [Mucilaginibacter polytrichastri]|nr:hypothetical protein [Mucilaginibacter polytrichastri]